MKSNQEMIRKIENFSITQRTSDGFFDGSELLRQWNAVDGHTKREMKKFLDSPATKEFIEALVIDENERKSHVAKMRYGDNQQVTRISKQNIHGAFLLHVDNQQVIKRL